MSDIVRFIPNFLKASSAVFTTGSPWEKGIATCFAFYNITRQHP